MKKRDIENAVQSKLIDDLEDVVRQVRQEYQGKVSNAWVFDYIEGFMKRMHPGNMDKLDYTRTEMQEKMHAVADKHMTKVQHHMSEIKNEDIGTIVHLAGNMYELIKKRTNAEVDYLVASREGYNSAEELVANEFYKSKAFKTKQAHKRWVNKFSKSLEEMLGKVQEMGDVVAAKRGFMWDMKLGAVKAYLLAKKHINLYVRNMGSDLKVAKEAILTNYKEYEKELMDKRYIV